MAIVTTDSKHYSNIAAAIREKTGEVTTYKPEEIPAGVGEVYKAGKQDGAQSEYDRFWDAYQYNGTRKSYIGGFSGIGWNPETFKPKYDMAVSNAYLMFSNFSYDFPINLKQILIDCGVSLTFPKCGNNSQVFEASRITDIGELDFSTCTRTNPVNVFNSCTHLKSIDKIIIPNIQTSFSKWFQNCTALENVIFEGTINANDFNVSWSPLNHDSLMSIINCLADKSGTGTTMTVTLGTGNLAKLTDAEKAIATQKGWTLA